MDIEINAPLSSCPPLAPAHGWHPLLNFCLILEGNYWSLYYSSIGAFQLSCVVPVFSSRSEKHLYRLDPSLMSVIPNAEE